jgi:hypothetical protein
MIFMVKSTTFIRLYDVLGYRWDRLYLVVLLTTIHNTRFFISKPKRSAFVVRNRALRAYCLHAAEFYGCHVGLGGFMIAGHGADD